MADYDDALRQIGIGDMGVPRRVQKAAAAFTERNRAYRAALGESESDKLETVLATHVYGAESHAEAPPEPVSADVARLAAYIRAASRHLAELPADGLFEGRGLFQSARQAPDQAAKRHKDPRP